MPYLDLVRLAAAIGCTVVLLGACTSLRDTQAQAVDFDDVWTARGIPCDGEDIEVLVKLKQEKRELTATSLAKSRCFPLAHPLWRATLPAQGPVAAELPVTVEAQISLRLGAQPTSGLLTLVAQDRIVVMADRVVVPLVRGASQSDAPPQPPGAGATGPSTETSAKGGAPGEGQMSSAPQPSAAAGVPAPSAGSGNAGAGTAQGAAGASGMNGSPRAGASGSTPAAAGSVSGSPAVGGAGAPAGGAGMPAAGMTAPPQAGRGGAAGDGVSGRGADTIAQISNIRFWYCVALSPNSCTCIENTSPYNEIGCTIRSSTCCFALADGTDVGCLCYRDDHPVCRGTEPMPEIVAHIEKCPP